MQLVTWIQYVFSRLLCIEDRDSACEFESYDMENSGGCFGSGDTMEGD